MSNNNLSNKDILVGRIYPAIKSCVNNRYKIIVAFFAYYSFVFSDEDFQLIARKPNVSEVVSILFSALIILNSINYMFNAYEQIKLEKKDEGWSKFWSMLWALKIEIPFAIVSVYMVYYAHSLIPN